MKIRKMPAGILCLIAFIVGTFIWWSVPCSIINIKPSEVSKIEIFDGNTGKSVAITDATIIEHIINNLNALSLKKERISLGVTGYSFRTTIYKIDGHEYKKFIINSSNTIRKDPFFYKDNSESIDYKYIKDLIDNKR